METVDSYAVRVAGTSFYQYAISSIRDGDECKLVPEPTNRYDPSAIMVQHLGQTIGYIPREYCDLFHQAMAVGSLKISVAGCGQPRGSEFVGVQLTVEVRFPQNHPAESPAESPTGSSTESTGEQL